MASAPSPEVRIGVLPGDGIGPEIVPVALAVAEASADREGLRLNWVQLPFGASAIETHGNPVPESTLTALDDLDLWVVGPHDSARYPAGHSDRAPGAVLRTHFGLFANLRPAQSFAGVASVAPAIDAMIVRENTEGLYADRNMSVGSGEFMPTPDIALAVGMVSRAATERIARTAFEVARGRKKHVTIVHKANVLRLTTGLFRDVCREVADDYPDVVVDDEHVDAMAAHVVRRPQDFDVIVTENLFGDILSDLAGELAGSIGIAPSVNCSQTVVMAQATHGAAPDIAGLGIANPVAIILSTAMALRRRGTMIGDDSLVATGGRVESAVAGTLGDGIATADLGGTASTREFGDAVIARITEA